MNLMKLFAQTIVLLILLAVAWVVWVYQDHLTPVAEELVTLYADWNRNAHWSKQGADRTAPPPAAPAPAQAPAAVPAVAATPLLRAGQDTPPAMTSERSTTVEPVAVDVAPVGAPAPQAVTPAPETAPLAAVSTHTQAPLADPSPAAVGSLAAPAAMATPASEPVVAAPVATGAPVAATAPVVAASAPLPQVGAAVSQAASAPGGDPSSIMGRAVAPHLSATVLVAKIADLPVDPQELHARARRAAWSGQTNVAIAAYQQLISIQPQSADAHGELGNVYYQEKRQEEAAEQYEKAALLLVAQGEQTRIWQLLQTLRSLDATRARAVEEKLLARGK